MAIKRESSLLNVSDFQILSSLAKEWSEISHIRAVCRVDWANTIREEPTDDVEFRHLRN